VKEIDFEIPYQSTGEPFSSRHVSVSSADAERTTANTSTGHMSLGIVTSTGHMSLGIVTAASACPDQLLRLSRQVAVDWLGAAARPPSPAAYQPIADSNSQSQQTL